MAQIFSTGPVHIGIGICAPGAAYQATPFLTGYYGTTREGPDITEEPSYFNVMNDLAGPIIPFDRGYAGSEHTIALIMTRWDGANDRVLNNPNPPTARPGGGGGPNTFGPGSEGPQDRGSLSSKRGNLQLLMLLSNGGVAVPVDATLVQWRRYYQCVNIGPNKPIWGNKENIRVRVFKAQNVFLGVPTLPFNNAAQTMFHMYDEGPGALPWTFTII